MTPTAYTMGNKKSYDEALQTEPEVKKTGQQIEADGQPYEGGIVFRTREAATEYLSRHPEWPYGIYGLVLPTGWDEDVRPMILPGEDHHRLKNSAIIIALDTHHCESCKRDANPTEAFTCPHCESEDTFDKRLPEWPCQRCEEYTALYQSVCVECSKELLATALAGLLGVEGVADPEDQKFYNPKEDFGDADHRVYLGAYL